MTHTDDEQRIRHAIDRQAAIDSIRAFAAPVVTRYNEAYNGYDRANDLELVDSVGKLDIEAIARIRLECVATLATRGITLVGDEEDVVTADWGMHANSDGSDSTTRMVCEPAVLWESPAYGWIVVEKAYTIAA